MAGNLTVNGTLTSLDTTNLDIEDNLFQLNAGLTGSPVNDSGMLINRGNQDNGIFMWDESADKFTLGLTTADGSATGNITLNSLGTLVANIEGNITGNVTGTVSDVSNHDTDDISEGSSNLYYTDARADARVNLQTGANLDLSSKSTSDLSEGTNEYFTTARARSSISASGDISYNSSTGVISFTASAAPVTSVNTQTGAVVLDSDDIAEGSTNLYYTDARARAAISESSTQLAYNSTTGVLTYTQGDTDTVSEGTSNLYYTTSRFDAAFSGKSTSDLSEGTNLYYTDARVQAVSINNVVEDTTPQLGGDLASNGNDILFADNDKAIFGAGSDLQIYHNANTSFITESGSSNLKIGGENLYLQNTAHNENYLEAIANGAVTLYYNNAVKLATTNTGIDVTGLTTTGDINFGDNDKAIFGAGSDLQLYHDGTNSFITNGTGILLQRADDIRLQNAAGSEVMIDATANGAVNLYHNNSAKLTTTSTGIDVPQQVQVVGSGDSILFLNTASDAGDKSLIKFGDNSDADAGYIDYDHGTNVLSFGAAAAERMRIDSSGNVGYWGDRPRQHLNCKRFRTHKLPS